MTANPSLAAWLTRLQVALMLAFGAEVLLWTLPTRTDAADVLIALVGYPAIGSVACDLLARYRVRNALGLVVVAGVCALIYGLLINPHIALAGVDDNTLTLFTRVLGAQTLAALGVLSLWLWWAVRGRAWPLALALIVIAGIGWGVWTQGSPMLPLGAPPPTLIALLAAAWGMLFGVIVLAGAARDSVRVERLSAREWVIVGTALALIGVVRVAQSAIDGVGLATVTLLIAFCIALLWFDRRKKGKTLIDGVRALTSTRVLITGIVFLAAGLVGVALPRGDGASAPVEVIAAAMTAFGFVWLPTVSAVLGARAFARQAKALRL